MCAWEWEGRREGGRKTGWERGDAEKMTDAVTEEDRWSDFHGHTEMKCLENIL